jgi:DNA-binding XRE family transcriptional regulator
MRRSSGRSRHLSRVRIEEGIMATSRKPDPGVPGESTTNRVAREEAIAARYAGRPSLRALYEGGQIDRLAFDEAKRVRAAGAPERPFRDLIVALRAERERQGLSLADLAERTGFDRAAIHKLEIGANANPTLTTLARYAAALGARIEWDLKTTAASGPADR